MSILNVPPDAAGIYKFPDGSAIWPIACTSRSRWYAKWAPCPREPHGAMLRGVDPQNGTREINWPFSSPEEAAQALAEGGEGPVSIAGAVMGGGI